MAVTISGSSGVTFPDSTVQSTTATTTVGALRAWGLVSWSGGTPTFVAGGNVSSVTDLGTGNMRWNFTTALPDANYSAVGSVQTDCIWLRAGKDTKTTTAIQFGFANYNNTSEVDPSSQVSMAVFR